MREQAFIFLNAVMFLTRIPCPKTLPFSQNYLDRALGYFPLVGWIVGGVGALTFLAADFLLPKTTALLLSMATTILLTGAFHEDGFTDFCDGFGGGWTKDKILAIMKDSRVGAFGVIGIALLLSIKFSLLLECESKHLAIFMVVAHSLSRMFAMSFYITLPYAKDNEEGKAKPIAKRLEPMVMAIAVFFGLAPLILLKSWLVFLIIPPLLLMHWLLGRYFEKWIGGYTGDCLGAAQQMSEVFIYLFLGFLLPPWTFT